MTLFFSGLSFAGYAARRMLGAGHGSALIVFALPD